MADGDIDYAISFREHGVELHGKGRDMEGDCPFCYKERHFFLNRETGQWDCKVCLESGNLYKFLRLSAAKYTKETTEKQYRSLAVKRGIPWGRLKAAGWYYNGDVGHWMLPIMSKTKSIVDVRRYNGKSVMSTKGCSLHIFGEELLLGRDTGRIWVCEGEWDAIALRYLFQRAGIPDTIVGVPGAGTFKKDWAQEFFMRRHVTLAYDNDEPGLRGMIRAAGFIRPVATNLDAIKWPEGLKDGYDIRDMVQRATMKKEPCIKVAGELLGLISNSLEKVNEFGKTEQVRLNSKTEPALQKPPIDFPKLVEQFRKWVRVDQTFVDALAICCAVSFANEVPGDPLWIYFVAPPGAGKTLILMSMQNSHRTLFRSTLTPASLVSGFQATPDPSLLPQMDGKTAIFKDGTELLAMHPDAKRETYGVLRGAFDGTVHKSFGNGVNREYKLHFNMIIGMTPAVHGDSQATMGDRFLKFEMKEDRVSVEAKILAAVTNIAKEDKMGDDLCDAMERFLNREVSLETIPQVPHPMVDKIVALAQILSALRAQVDRENYGERDMRYRPVHEVGTRIAKQLTKMAMMLAFVYGRNKTDWIEYRLIQKVALDTAIGFHLDILACLVRHQGKELTRDAIAHVTSLPNATISKRLLDMEQLGLVARGKISAWRGAGIAPTVYRPTATMLNLWKRASIDWSLIRLRKLPAVSSGPAKVLYQTTQTAAETASAGLPPASGNSPRPANSNGHINGHAAQRRFTFPSRPA